MEDEQKCIAVQTEGNIFKTGEDDALEGKRVQLTQVVLRRKNYIGLARGYNKGK